MLKVFVLDRSWQIIAIALVSIFFLFQYSDLLNSPEGRGALIVDTQAQATYYSTEKFGTFLAPLIYKIERKQKEASPPQEKSIFGFGIGQYSGAVGEQIAVVIPGSPAQKAGILVGDSILSINKIPISQLNYVTANSEIESLKDVVTLELQSSNAKIPRVVTLKKAPVVTTFQTNKDYSADVPLHASQRELDQALIDSRDNVKYEIELSPYASIPATFCWIILETLLLLVFSWLPFYFEKKENAKNRLAGIFIIIFGVPLTLFILAICILLVPHVEAITMIGVPTGGFLDMGGLILIIWLFGLMIFNIFFMLISIHLKKGSWFNKRHFITDLAQTR